MSDRGHQQSGPGAGNKNAAHGTRLAVLQCLAALPPRRRLSAGNEQSEETPHTDCFRFVVAATAFVAAAGAFPPRNPRSSRHRSVEPGYSRQFAGVRRPALVN